MVTKIIDNGSDFNFIIDVSPDRLNVTDWVFFLTNIDNLTVEEITAQCTVDEIMTAVTSAQSTLQSLVTKDSRYIVLPAGAGVSYNKGSSIKINTGSKTIYRKIANISGDTLVLTQTVGIELPVGTIVDNSGNTGTYAVTVDTASLPTPFILGGRYSIQIKADSIGVDINTGTFDISDYDRAIELGSDLEEIQDGLKEISSGTSPTASINTAPSSMSSIHNAPRFEDLDHRTITAAGESFTLTNTSPEKYIYVDSGDIDITANGSSNNYTTGDLVILQDSVISQAEYDALGVTDLIILEGVTFKIY